MTDNAKIHNDDNWSAAGVVGMFDSALLSRARRRHRMASFWMCLIVGVILGIPLFLTWQKLEDSRRLTLIEEFSSRRSTLQDLPNDKNPAVVAQLEKADQLRQQATTGSVGESVTVLREALARLRDAAAIDQKIEQIRPLLNPLGESLSPATTPEEGSPWLLSSAVIEQRLSELQKRHAQIVTHLNLGETTQAEQMLAELLRDVGQLQRDNVSAMHTETARRNWLRLQTKIPGRLQTHAALPAISRAGKDAETGWDSGDWANSRLLYSGAAEDLERFLNAESTPTEKAELLQNDAEAVVRLETEKADLMQQIRSLRDEKIKLGEQLSATNAQRLTAEDKVATLTKERDRLQTAEATATAELTKLRPLKDQLATANSSLQEAQESVTRLTQAKSVAEDSLRRIEAQLAAKDSEIKALRTAATNGDGNSVIVQVSASLAAIDSRLASGINGKDTATAAELAREQLADALSEYDKAVQLKHQAIADKYRPTGKRVKGIEGTIAQAEATLRSGLNVLDEPLANQFDELQTEIESAENSYQMLLKEVAPEHKDAVALKQRIMGLMKQQSRLAAAKDRHMGKASPVASSIVAICRTEVQNLLTERQAADFERLKATGKVPSAANLKMVPIAAGTFTMGEGSSAKETSIAKPFYAGKYEVTICQILTWLNSSDASFKDEWIDLSDTDCPVRKSGSKFELNTNTKFGTSPDQPMVCISWYGAKAFCDWCSKQDLLFRYRLPSEAEWEYLARASSTTAYPWGDPCNGTEADINGNYPHGTKSKGPYLQRTTTVGQYPANAWGIFDTVGNAWEWCEDNYDSSGSSRVLRGGSWYSNAVHARSSNRYFSTAYDRYNYFGFRVVAE